MKCNSDKRKGLSRALSQTNFRTLAPYGKPTRRVNIKPNNVVNHSDLSIPTSTPSNLCHRPRHLVSFSASDTKDIRSHSRADCIIIRKITKTGKRYGSVGEVRQKVTPSFSPCRSFSRSLHIFLRLLQSPLQGGCYPGTHEANGN